MARCRVLIVDDDALARQVLGHFFSHAGHDVVFAQSGLEALEILRADPPDAIVLDSMMPVMGGMEFLRRWRLSLSPAIAPSPRVFVVSARALPEHQAEAAALGVERFFAKPVDPMELLRCITTPPQCDRGSTCAA